MYRGKKLSEAMDCLEAYATLTDSVFDVIDFLAVEDASLRPASQLLEHVRRRHLHKHVGEVVVPPIKRDDICALSDDDLLRTIARHSTPLCGNQPVS